ncbi:MAG: DegT/DnrJ/EryC1/StrS family aminotransferase [Cyanobacteria bacterium HKST-UBA04]|nr:DegT/DnrJ/EryC1/StrS family aminotransferase [Cyanobacteria bacterium HKST-UBA04]
MTGPQTTTPPQPTTQRQIHIAKPTLGDEEWQALRDPLLSGWLTQGPQVAAFEKRFAARHQAAHALATTSCTTALHLILAALGIGPGDEVIVPALSWVASANVVLYCGATPVFVDIDPATFNLDAKQVAAAITPKTKAVMAVHLFGLCADMDAVQDAAGELPVIEDAACAVGSSYKGRAAGTLGLAGAFSFHPRKTITTGEGGMVTTNDQPLAECMDQLRNHGASLSEEQRHHGPRPYLLADYNLMGFNYRMTDMQGAVGLVQLDRLDGLLEERRRWAAWYNEQLAELPWLLTPVVPDGYEHGWQAYVCRVNEQTAPAPRNDMMETLQQAGISTRPGTHAIPTLGYYRQRFGYDETRFPNSWQAENTSLALPLHNQMTPEDYQYVVDHLKAL